MSFASTPPTRTDTQERILAAAEALFAERGLAGTSVRDIAATVGLSAPSLYNHFAGKQDLYEAVLESGVRPLLDLMQGLPAREQTIDAREALIGSIMRHLSSRPHLPRLIHHEVVSGGAYLSKLARSWIRPILEQGIAEMKRGDASRWDEHEYPLMMTAWLNLVFGHFAMAPLLDVVFDTDVLSAESLGRQTRFLQKLARVVAEAQPELAAGPTAPTPQTSPPPSTTRNPRTPRSEGSPT